MGGDPALWQAEAVRVLLKRVVRLERQLCCLTPAWAPGYWQPLPYVVKEDVLNYVEGSLDSVHYAAQTDPDLVKDKQHSDDGLLNPVRDAAQTELGLANDMRHSGDGLLDPVHYAEQADLDLANDMQHSEDGSLDPVHYAAQADLDLASDMQHSDDGLLDPVHSDLMGPSEKDPCYMCGWFLGQDFVRDTDKDGLDYWICGPCDMRQRKREERKERKYKRKQRWNVDTNKN